MKETSIERVVVRFCGDSGDGMQLTGNLFSNLSAILGDEISTFPDFPAEIRAPQGTLGGVSGFQVQLGSSHVYTPGDYADVLVAMNPAALKTNVQFVKPDGLIVVDSDSFKETDLKKALFVTDNPFTELGLPETMQILQIALTQLTKDSLADSGMDQKAIVRCKNMFALGVVCWLFERPIDKAIHFLCNKFAKKPDLLRANAKVITDGFNYAANLHLNINTFHIERSAELPHGMYTSIAGNKATAWGLIAAAEKAGRQLFLGSYPITPATDIMQELAARKDVGAMVVQCEDEISGVCTALGASFAGCLAVTSTSGPGLALKSEAIGLGTIAELPLVVVDVMRGGPSTGMPTKTEQTDLLQAIYGRNGESPLVVVAATSSADCFQTAYMAAKIALENATPVIMLSDTYLANGTSLWKLPKLADLPAIHPCYVPDNFEGKYNVACRDEESKVRYWAYAGQQGLEHRNIGLERDYNTGSISTNPANHQRMVDARREKIARIAHKIPQLQVEGDPTADTLLVGWGSTRGHLLSAVHELEQQGVKTALAHFTYISPLPANTADVLSRYKRIIVCELNTGQFASYLRSQIEGICVEQVNKVEGQPFSVGDIIKHVLA
ncbi:MAG: 2-oxoacid:acceptor oxidoreductase subunit alpha [Paludibacteraceae bacterium]|nr:2-oxoacid:acceptor oxidoreductase subunit alpha [Paludibacteraceae bacterium]